MKIGLDVMGGDFAPAEAVKGVLELLNAPDLVDVQLTLFGDEAQIKEHLNGHQLPANYRIVHTEESIGMAEHPTKAISQKRQSTISLGLKMLAEGELDAFTGAGNTGAMMVGALYTVKAIDGVLRPSLTTLVPKIDGSTGLMLDVGANADVKPDVLVQFAVLGSLYAQHVLGIASPKVGLLSIGEEKEKGNLLNQAVYPVLEEKRNINFIGNIEGRDLFSDKADVIVCDGFTGNVVLKEAEAFYSIMRRRGLVDDYFSRFNYEEYGGTPILGINSTVMIGHGISSPEAIKNMMLLTGEIAAARLPEKIMQAFQ